MNQALHILRKDTRCLWYELSIALLFQALFTFFEMRPHQVFGIVDGFVGLGGAETLVDFLLPVAWWYLIAALVHEEPLPGDRQFWVTRPYSWKSLLAAKVLFILAFVNLPVLIADGFILTAPGFSIAEDWKGMLWRQIPFTIAVLLPPLALASLTRNLGQVIVAILLVVLRIVLNSIQPQNPLQGGYSALGWIDVTESTIVLLAILSAIVLIQYGSRRTWLARAVFGAYVIFPSFSIPLRWQLDVQARVKPPAVDRSPIRIGFDSARGRRAPLARVPGFTRVDVALPVSVSGTPDGVDLVSGQATLTIGGNSYFEGATLVRDKTGYWENIMLPEKVYLSMGNRPVTIRIEPVVTAERRTEFRAPLETGTVLVPGVGICESGRQGQQFLQVHCRSALLSPLRTRTYADYPGWDTPVPTGRPYEQPHEQMTGELSDSPFPAGLSLSPVHAVQVFSLAGNELAAATNYPGTQLVFQTEHPLAHFQTEIELKPVKLDDYVVVVPQH
jgi:hypothetical protein